MPRTIDDIFGDNKNLRTLHVIGFDDGGIFGISSDEETLRICDESLAKQLASLPGAKSERGNLDINGYRVRGGYNISNDSYSAHVTKLKCSQIQVADIWLEGPSKNEPSLHQIVNVGDPNGMYLSYSFGMNGKGLQGEVYRDTSIGGPIEAFKKTTQQQDDAFQSKMESQVGKTGTYGIDDICRSWSQRQFKDAPGIITTPPARNVTPQFNVSPSPLRSTTGASSTTGTGTSR